MTTLEERAEIMSIGASARAGADLELDDYILTHLKEVQREARIAGLEEAAREIRVKCSACDNGVAGIERHISPAGFNEQGEATEFWEIAEPLECQYCGIPMSNIRARIEQIKKEE